MKEDPNFNLLDILGFLVFRIKDNKNFVLEGDIPIWCNFFKIEDLNNLSLEELTRFFPIIRSFIHQADKILDNGTENKVESGIWEQETESGEKKYLSCDLVLSEAGKYLIVKNQDTIFYEQKKELFELRKFKLMFEQLKEKNESIIFTLKAVLPEFKEPINSLFQGLNDLSERDEFTANSFQFYLLLRKCDRIKSLYKELLEINYNYD